MMNIAMDIVIQSIGVFGIIANIISFQCKKHNKILFFRTLNELFFAVQYLLLGAYTGMAMDFFGCIRNIIFTKQVEKGQKTTVSTIVFSIVFFTFGILTWQGFKSILIIIAKVLSTIAFGNKNTSVVRAIVLVTSLSWLVYNYAVFSVAGVLCEAVSAISVIIGIIRFDIVPKVLKDK